MVRKAFVNRGLLIILLLLGMPQLHAQERSFQQCIADWQQQGRDRGLSETTITRVLPRLKHLPEIIVYDRRQPEFTQTFAQYLQQRLTPARIDRGASLFELHKDFLAGVEQQHGVPGRFLVAFWGMETNFGSYLGKMPTLDSLATLACDPRRSEYFTEELYQALMLMERESLSMSQMHGSWAGAMGHTQFMPSSYRRYAIDGDGDHRIDLWRSKQDALSSAGNFLNRLGWNANQGWGAEVILPETFPYAESGLHNRQPTAYWAQVGVRFANGEHLTETDVPSAVLLPAGHTGPAFLVFPNFNVIMRWNNSESYALAVGLLADRIAGMRPLLNPPSLSEPALSKQALWSIQSRLNELGYDAGKPDGVMGPNTRAALRAFQQASGLVADGYPDPDTQARLLRTGSG
jgi:membrane-bound lytic murein transglycosylase B